MPMGLTALVPLSAGRLFDTPFDPWAMAVWPSKAVHDKSHAPDPGVHQPSHLQESASDRIPDWASSPCRLPGPVRR